MVENALELLARKKVIELDEERKASMVSNLLVVLCSEQNTQPVVNTERCTGKRGGSRGGQEVVPAANLPGPLRRPGRVGRGRSCEA